MSALPPKGAAAVADLRVRFGPKADITGQRKLLRNGAVTATEFWVFAPPTI